MILKKFVACIMVVSLCGDLVFGMPMPRLVPGLLGRFPAPDQAFIVQTSALLGLEFSQDGKSMLRARSGGAEPGPVDAAAAKRIFTFLSKLPKDDPEQGMARALRSYLAPRMAPADLENNMFLKRDENGRLVLTPVGRNALLDILTASDGSLLEPMPEVKPKNGVLLVSEDPQTGGSLKSAGARALEGRSRAVTDAPGVFDGSRRTTARTHLPSGPSTGPLPGSRITLGHFDWSSLDRAVSAGGLKGFSAPAGLSGYSIDEEAGTVRVLVAADRAAEKDYFKIARPGSVQDDIYAQTGLDGDLLDGHGAKVVRAIDNLVAVDVPLPQAAALGLELRKRGIESRPARAFRASAAALSSPAAALLGGQFLPLPTAKGSFGPQLADSRMTLDAEGLTRAGMRGEGTTVGIIDSGIDMDHPDFKDAAGNSRVVGYVDFTDEGTEDVIGHGTHVAGTIGGDGSASGGKYRGLAERTRFKVAKVFGTEDDTDESVLLAAMKWMASDDEKTGGKVDIINMSLGGPGAPNRDPLSAMANHLTVKENILVVAAAGNEGPWAGSVGAPGNARYALTVGGVNKDGEVPFFSSRGPIYGPDGRELYAKPDVLGISGDVDLSRIEAEIIKVDDENAERGEGIIPVSVGAGLKSVKAAPNSPKCIYAPGVIGPRSGDDPDNICVLDGNPDYRYMSGTSMATPMVTGMSADVIGYLKSQGADYSVFHVRALVMETAKDLGKKREEQGAGLVNGARLADAVVERVKQGIPVGNIAFALAMRLTTKDREDMKHQTRYELTALGLLDTETGHLVNTEEELEAALDEIRRSKPAVLYVRREDGLIAG